MKLDHIPRLRIPIVILMHERRPDDWQHMYSVSCPLSLSTTIECWGEVIAAEAPVYKCIDLKENVVRFFSHGWFAVAYFRYDNRKYTCEVELLQPFFTPEEE